MLALTSQASRATLYSPGAMTCPRLLSLLLVKPSIDNLPFGGAVAGANWMGPGAMKSGGADVVISGAQNKDSARALELADHLEAAGLTVWLADRSIDGAHNYGPGHAC